MALVIGAAVAVAAVQRRPWLACPAAAGVGRRADVAVAATSRVGGKNAACVAVALVVCARVAVVAGHGPAGGTDADAAHIAGRAGVAVVAGQRVVRVDAAGLRVAAVIRAQIPIAACLGSARLAAALGAGVDQRASVAVGAGSAVGDREAPLERVAAVVCAGVAIIADHQRAALACATLAGIVLAADAAVLARLGVVRRRAASVGVAAVVGARVAVVADLGGARLANSGLAGVRCGARVAVVALGVVVLEDAARLGRAAVVCAGVAVVADEHRAALAGAARAGVDLGARAAVVAR